MPLNNPPFVPEHPTPGDKCTSLHTPKASRRNRRVHSRTAPPSFSAWHLLPRGYRPERGLRGHFSAILAGLFSFRFPPDRAYRLWQWRERGVAPSPVHLFLLLTIAESMGLREGILMCPDRDMPAAVDLASVPIASSADHLSTNRTPS